MFQNIFNKKKPALYPAKVRAGHLKINGAPHVFFLQLWAQVPETLVDSSAVGDELPSTPKHGEMHVWLSDSRRQILQQH